MSEALEESRGDYGERYSYYTSKDKVLTVKGIHPDALYMAAESFEAENHDWSQMKQDADEGMGVYFIPKTPQTHSEMKSMVEEYFGITGSFPSQGHFHFITNDGYDIIPTTENDEGVIEPVFHIRKSDDKRSWEADFDNAPYESFDEALADSVSFPEKEYEIDDRDIYNPERAAMDMIRSNRALREQMEEQGVYVGRHPGYYDDNGQWVELMEHYDDYERIPNWLQGLVGVGLVGGLAFLLNKMTNTFADTGNNTTEPTE